MNRNMILSILWAGLLAYLVSTHSQGWLIGWAGFALGANVNEAIKKIYE